MRIKRRVKHWERPEWRASGLQVPGCAGQATGTAEIKTVGTQRCGQLFET